MSKEDKANYIVHFDRIMVNSMMMNSGIFVGTNVQYGWNSHNKTNAGMMGISGDGNTFSHNFHVLYDNDGIDTLIDDQNRYVSTS